MATINNGDPTLLDMVKRTDPDGAIAKIVEALSKKNPILMDAAAKEGNLATGHKFTSRNTLPTVGWRQFNSGIAASKSTTEQYQEVCGMLEGFSYVDCGLAELNGNQAAFRASEDMAFMSSLNIEAARALMYASTFTSPEQIHGFTPRFDVLAGPTGTGAPNGVGQIVNYDDAYYGGGTASANADQSSIWFICWGADTVSLIYPKGQNGGLMSEDLGKQIVDAGAPNPSGGTPSGLKYTAWVTHWKWNLGLCVQDPRQVSRVCNIDQSALLATPGTADANLAAIVNAMITAYYRLYDPTVGNLIIYTGRQVAEFLHRGAMAKASGMISIGEYGGRPVTTFMGYPIRVVDALGTSESLVA
jgi:hypothetical protein